MIFQPREFFWSHFLHFFTFFSGRPSWKIAIFSGSSFYMAERHFSHLVSHLPIGFKHIFHLLLTFVSFCPYRISTLFSHHSLKITLPLLTKPISHPPAHEFRETKKNLSKRQWVINISGRRHGRSPFKEVQCKSSTLVDSLALCFFFYQQKIVFGWMAM